MRMDTPNGVFFHRKPWFIEVHLICQEQNPSKHSCHFAPLCHARPIQGHSALSIPIHSSSIWVLEELRPWVVARDRPRVDAYLGVRAS